MGQRARRAVGFNARAPLIMRLRVTADTMTRAALCLGLLVWSADSPCDGQERETASEEEVKEAHEPVSRLRAVALQNNIDFGIGSNDRTGLRLLIQPWQAEIGTGIWWRMKTFSALPVLYRPNANESEGGTFGLGDPEISVFWSPRKAGRSVLGVGPVVRFPLATDDALGSGKWSAGVTALAVARPGRWLFGVRTYNIWSFAGDEERSDVNQFLLNYISPTRARERLVCHQRSRRDGGLERAKRRPMAGPHRRGRRQARQSGQTWCRPSSFRLLQRHPSRDPAARGLDSTNTASVPIRELNASYPSPTSVGTAPEGALTMMVHGMTFGFTF